MLLKLLIKAITITLLVCIFIISQLKRLREYIYYHLYPQIFSRTFLLYKLKHFFEDNLSFIGLFKMQPS
jgi:hypothetical protein